MRRDAVRSGALKARRARSRAVGPCVGAQSRAPPGDRDPSSGGGRPRTRRDGTLIPEPTGTGRYAALLNRGHGRRHTVHHLWTFWRAPRRRPRHPPGHPTHPAPGEQVNRAPGPDRPGCTSSSRAAGLCVDPRFP